MNELERNEFLERRKCGIGGSDVAAILGLSRWKTPYQIWEDKTGRAVQTETQSRAQYFGSMLEQFVADEFVRETGMQVQRRTKQYQHKEHPELIANIDRYVVGGAILECKTSSTGKDWGDSGSDEIPDYYMTQVQHYLHVTGYSRAYLAALIAEYGFEFRVYEISYDKDLAEYCAGKCVEFWADYVLKDTPPPVTVRDDLDSIYPGRLGEVKVADAEAVRLISEYNAVSIQAKTDADRKKELAAELKLFCGDADTITDGSGRVLLTNRRSRDTVQTVTDWEGIARELCPAEWITEEIIAKHKTETIKPGSRRLLVKNNKEKEQ